MLFNSFQFLVFFLIVTGAYYALGHRHRWMWLLIASCYFYMVCVPAYILVLVILILVDYSSARLMEVASIRLKKTILLVSIASNIGMLGFFKYFNFGYDQAVALGSLFGWHIKPLVLDVILPIGLSFHTFQSMAYTIEVYRGVQPAERHLGIYSLYVMFYPQMVAGPIERPQHLLRQFRRRINFDYDRVTDGLKVMLWGLFKKVVIADNLALIVNAAYEDPVRYSGWPLVIATYAFSLQIFCDFSGYSDIARGAARVLGFELMKNFDIPYCASSLAEFWRRWHISLSTWFRDYLYIPLGGNRRGQFRTILNILIVFLISGLWHGASWAFVVWGGLHGLYLVAGMLLEPSRTKVLKALGLTHYTKLRSLAGWFLTFHFVWFSWIFFRAGSVPKAVAILRNLFTFKSGPLPALPGFGFAEWLGLGLAVLIMEVIHWAQRRQVLRLYFCGLPNVARWSVYAAAAFFILIWGQFRGQNFIYFQF